MKTLFLILGLAITINLYSQTSRVLIEADSLFCVLAAQKGIGEAFVYYAADNAVKLQPDGYPQTGAEVKESYFKGFSNATFHLKWQALKQYLNKSGDIGYTYGIWQRYDKVTGSKILEGTYYTVWEKQVDGSWKYIFDTGEVGLKKK